MTALLRRPSLIVAELAAIALAGALAATLPQEPDSDAIRRFAERWPALARGAAALGLHDVMRSTWFLGLVAAAACSLLAVQWDQWRRVRRLALERVEPSSLSRAPFRREAAAATCRRVPDRPVVASTGRLGALGSPVFHLGLVVVLVAGLWRLLVSSDATTRVIEGQTLPPGSDAWQAQRGGVAARPFAIEEPLTLEEVRADRYPSGVLRQLDATLRLGSAAEPEHLAINAPLDVGGERIYLTSSLGVAALLEHRLAGATEVRTELLDLETAGARAWGTLRLADGREARLKARIGARGRPELLEVRVARGRTLLSVEELVPGAEVEIGPQESLSLVGLPFWIQLRGSRDPTRALFFAGVAVAIAGASLMFGVVRVDSAVFVDGERVVVAVRPQRFAPLYADRFESLCREWIG